MKFSWIELTNYSNVLWKITYVAEATFFTPITIRPKCCNMWGFFTKKIVFILNFCVLFHIREACTKKTAKSANWNRWFSKIGHA